MNRYNPILSYGLLYAILFFANPASGSDTPPLRDRNEFAAALAKVKVGMSKSEIFALVGKPDDKLSPNDLNGILRPGVTISITGLKEIWCYGTRKHLTFPTLGQIQIDNADNCQWVYGGRDTPIDPRLFNENEIRQLLELIDNVSSVDKPIALIQIVNTLQSLGKERALAILDEYLRIVSEILSFSEDEFFHILRVLFEVPDDPGYMPVMGIGAPIPPQPLDPKLFPRFPIVIVDDIPLHLPVGYMLSGLPQQPREHVSYFRKHGTIRSKPLHPTDQPLSILSKFCASREWITWLKQIMPDFDISGMQERIAEQLLSMLVTVYPMKMDQYGSRLFPTCQDRQQPFPKKWRKIVEDVAKLNIVWDSPRNIYTFRSGSFISEE